MALSFPANTSFTHTPVLPSPMEWTDEDAAFFGGVLDGSPVPDELAMPWNQGLEIKTSAQNGLNNESLTEPVDATGAGFTVQVGEPNEAAVGSTEFVTEVRLSDILCIRGAGNGHSANKHFRELIASNTPRYDMMMTIEDKEAFSEQIWASLQEKGTRFLKPTDRNSNMYEVLDHERSVRKILFALRDCRPRGEPKTTSATVETKKRASGKVASGKTKRKKEGEPPCEPKFVDDAARAEIATLYQHETIQEEMKRSWKGDFDNKKKLFEEQLLQRYRAAALQGMSPAMFTNRLVDVLLKEIRDDIST